MSDQSNGRSADAEPGWYPDPSDDSRLRWWNGTEWGQSIEGGLRVEVKLLQGRLVLEGDAITVTFNRIAAVNMKTRSYTVRVSDLAALEQRGSGITQRTLWLRQTEDPAADSPPRGSNPYVLAYLPKHQPEVDLLVAEVDARGGPPAQPVRFMSKQEFKGKTPSENQTRRAEAREEKRGLAKERSEQKQLAKDARAAEVLERCGREVASGVVGTDKVTIYERGFVRIATVLFGGDTMPERLMGIEASDLARKKSGVARGASYVVTGGFNMLYSNKKGDVYLTVVTEHKTYSLQQQASDRSLKAIKRLEAAGNAVLRELELAANATPATVPTEGRKLSERLAQLAELLQEGLISQQEHDEKRRVLLDEI